MPCTHSITNTEWVETEHRYTGEVEGEWVTTTQSTTEDIDVGRFRCHVCGEVFYYTGHWKRFFEEGVPCPGSDRLK